MKLLKSYNKYETRRICVSI